MITTFMDKVQSTKPLNRYITNHYNKLQSNIKPKDENLTIQNFQGFDLIR